MKKILFTIAFLAVGMVASAQNFIDDLDNESLLGTWEATSMTGTFHSFNNEDRSKTVSSIKFSDGNYTMITFTDGSQTLFKGYWVTCGRTDRYYLHMAPWNSGNSFVNFRVLQFHEGVLTIVSYDRMGTMYLKKQETNSVQAARADASADGRTYTLNGTEAAGQTRGIVIQDGKKTVRK